MISRILIAFAGLVLAFVVLVALQPSRFRVERSVAIAAPPAAIFPHLDNPAKSHVWSPWAKLDPGARHAFEGPAAGVGASSTWSGNSEVGEGRQTIVESRRDEFVRLRLDFAKPFASTSMAEFALRPDGRHTHVTWSVAGESNFLCKAIGLFLSRDKMIGSQFEKGLADLRALVEGSHDSNRPVASHSVRKGT
jgi:hypothetical protein